MVRSRRGVIQAGPPVKARLQQAARGALDLPGATARTIGAAAEALAGTKGGKAARRGAQKVHKKGLDGNSR